MKAKLPRLAVILTVTLVVAIGMYMYHQSVAERENQYIESTKAEFRLVDAMIAQGDLVGAQKKIDSLNLTLMDEVFLVQLEILQDDLNEKRDMSK